MGDVDIQSIPALHITELTHVEPLRISQISHIAPAAVHVKELNHIDPISIESLRIDEVHNIDPVRVERFDVTHLPTVNISMSRVPTVDLNVRRVPPVAIALRQNFVAPSQYTMHATMLGIEFLRLHIHGKTVIAPCDQVPREQVRVHSRSFPDVAALGSPGIPAQCTTRTTRTTCTTRRTGPPARCAPAHRQPAPPPRPRFVPAPRERPPLSAGRPQFTYSLGRADEDRGGSSVGWGGHE